eukprot:2665478-Heterocapsa_arctica.AAC.1
MGDAAHSADLADGNELAVFFAQARAGRGSENGKMWLYNESFLHLVSSGNGVLTANLEVVLRP